MNSRIVNIILSDDDMQGFEITMVVDETTTEEYLLNYVMTEVSTFLVTHNLVNVQERLYSKILHIHDWRPSEIYQETQLNYYVCTGCGSEDMLQEEREYELMMKN
jgi:hypothetical protein